MKKTLVSLALGVAAAAGAFAAPAASKPSPNPAATSPPASAPTAAPTPAPAVPAAPAATPNQLKVSVDERTLGVGSMRMRTGKLLNVGPDETLPGNVYAGVGSAQVQGTITGDLWLAASGTTIPGKVLGDLQYGGARINVGGSIGGDARIFASEVTLDGPIGGDLMVWSPALVLDPAAAVQGSTMLFAGQASLSGKYNGPVWIKAGKVELMGDFADDVWVKCDELIVGPQAKFQRNLAYRAKDAEIPAGAVAGQTTVLPEDADIVAARAAKAGVEESSGSFHLLWRSWLAIGTVAAGTLLILFFSRFIGAIAAAGSTGAALALAFGIGLVALFVMIVVGLALCCFVLPGPAVWAALVALYYVGGVIGRILVGQWALRPLAKRLVHPMLGLLVGVALILLIGLIPFLGSLVSFVVAVTGMGVVLNHLRAAQTAPPAAPPPASSAGPAAPTPAT